MYLDQSAIIIDVRTVEEYKMGHITPSQNIVLDLLDRHIKKLKNRNLPVITCCRSGYRSGIASKIWTNMVSGMLMEEVGLL